MNVVERRILDRFKALLLKRVSLYRMILFGSRARGDAIQSSDMDVVVILNGPSSQSDLDYISECAWEASFEEGIVTVPVVFTREEWENGPERYSLLAKVVSKEGVVI
jgi:predicted nucleotidyltransferase